MLEWANLPMTEAYLVDTDLNGDPICNLGGTPQLTLDVNGKLQKNSANPQADSTVICLNRDAAHSVRVTPTNQPPLLVEWKGSL
jgi:hypothetical protein